MVPFGGAPCYAIALRGGEQGKLRLTTSGKGNLYRTEVELVLY
jgi:hypothetical protein